MTERPTWGSRIGFIFAVAGSAIGLANIWRFPYITGENGGAAFILLYIFCLALIGFPVFIAEVLIGRTTQTNPSSAFLRLGGSRPWSWLGKMTIVTGFLVSTFYSAVAGWIFGYLYEAFAGNLSHFTHPQQALAHFENLTMNPSWGVGFHFLFLLGCTLVLYAGVREGIERWNKVLMPALFAVLILLVIRGVTLSGALDGIYYLLTPNWSDLTPMAFLLALGQAFFTLSLGQGTMVTYGSYLSKRENLIKSCLPVVFMDTFVSILAAVAVFSIVFAGGMRPDSGPGLLFHTLPMIFSTIPWGHLVAVFFFFLVLIAALTSQISAMEPSIAYLIDERNWSRHKAVAAVAIAVFLVGLPSALSTSLLRHYTLFGRDFLDAIGMLCSSLLIPVGGFVAVILVGWFWGADKAIDEAKFGSEETFAKNPWIGRYLRISFTITAPLLILFVFLHAMGAFE